MHIAGQPQPIMSYVCRIDEHAIKLVAGSTGWRSEDFALWLWALDRATNPLASLRQYALDGWIISTTGRSITLSGVSAIYEPCVELTLNQFIRLVKCRAILHDMVDEVRSDYSILPHGAVCIGGVPMKKYLQDLPDNIDAKDMWLSQMIGWADS